MQIKILWLERSDLYAVRRGKEAGLRLGVQIDSVDALDLTFVADGSQIGVFAHGRNIVADYDGIIIRSFMPFVSEALTLARLFREAGKVVVDESMTDEGYAISKMHDYIVLASQGIGVPRTRQVFDPDHAESFASELGYPCVVKGIHGAEGRHVYKADSSEQLRKLVLGYRPGELMVQEFLPAEVDYRVIVIGYKALPIYVSRKPRADDFRTNFEQNEEVLPLRLSDASQLGIIAEGAARALRREFAGVDVRCRGTTPLVLEANRRPGFKGFEQATGFDVAEAFIEYVVEKCRAKRRAE